ncbi:hypothetical protein BDV28DRAFT_146106 [Aspergillus coremiiformis]|uniref:Uncharacterized protein n=1 Tax=Aspergillus coremiiformis TaxID=138285 RepID=A0A5N6ZCQ7_9EURO|nr:hypothetical protein BDV28DRAFT_146106 [Aspergillus coremiiformis]
MAQFSRQIVLHLLVYCIFTLGITLALGDSTDPSLHSQSIEKRAKVPLIPSVGEALNHLKKPAKGQSLFFQAEAIISASKYAQANNLWLLGDADDGSQWATFEGGPFMVYNVLRTRGQPTWDNNELQMAQAAVCNAYAHNAHGDTIVILPYREPRRFSFWHGELEMLKRNPNVGKILAYDMKDGTRMPEGAPRELWPEKQPKTEHAG